MDAELRYNNWYTTMEMEEYSIHAKYYAQKKPEKLAFVCVCVCGCV